VSDSDVLQHLQEGLPAMTASLAELVGAESPSADREATRSCGRALERQVAELLDTPAERIERDGRTHLRWRFGGPTRVLLLGHLDTVWPLGTLARWPFAVEGTHATGPGCFDMKAGLVQGLFAIAELSDRRGVSLLVTSDEEVGSPSSRTLIEESALGAEAVLVLEPSADGALKTSRKGTSNYVLSVAGRAAHAGLEPEKGANAGLELARQLLALEPLGSPADGTTVTPTTLTAGTTSNTVPASASACIDVRATSVEEQQRVDAALRALLPQLPGTSLEVSGGPNRPPLPTAAADDLFRLAVDVATRLGLPTLRAVGVGGGSDGNFTAAMGVPTLDGLGPVGSGAHAEGEHVVLSAMPERAALVSLLLTELLAGR
jgi:glutamate carboxypeptidase